MPKVHLPPGQPGRIAEIRHVLGLTQAELAERMSTPEAVINRVDVTRLENGDNKASSHKMRSALARGLGVDMATLDAFLKGKITTAAALRRARKAA